MDLFREHCSTPYYCWPVWQYEAICLDCGAHLYMPDGEGCLYCGGDALRTIGQATYEIRMNARTGGITINMEKGSAT